MQQNGIAEIVDFGSATVKDFGDSNPKPFRVAGQLFVAVPDISIPAMQRLAKMREGFSADSDSDDIEEKLKLIYVMFDELLLPEYTAAFHAALNSKTKPIGLGKLMSILEWLLEEYGVRPTQESSDSSAPSTVNISTSSMGGVSPAE